jgi:hypothetical protein
MANALMWLDHGILANQLSCGIENMAGGGNHCCRESNAVNSVQGRLTSSGIQ